MGEHIFSFDGFSYSFIGQCRRVSYWKCVTEDCQGYVESWGYPLQVKYITEHSCFQQFCEEDIFDSLSRHGDLEEREINDENCDAFSNGGKPLDDDRDTVCPTAVSKRRRARLPRSSKPPSKTVPKFSMVGNNCDIYRNKLLNKASKGFNRLPALVKGYTDEVVAIKNIDPVEELPEAFSGLDTGSSCDYVTNVSHSRNTESLSKNIVENNCISKVSKGKKKLPAGVNTPKMNSELWDTILEEDGFDINKNRNTTLVGENIFVGENKITNAHSLDGKQDSRRLRRKNKDSVQKNLGTLKNNYFYQNKLTKMVSKSIVNRSPVDSVMETNINVTFQREEAHGSGFKQFDMESLYSDAADHLSDFVGESDNLSGKAVVNKKTRVVKKSVNSKKFKKERGVGKLIIRKHESVEGSRKSLRKTFNVKSELQSSTVISFSTDESRSSGNPACTPDVKVLTPLEKNVFEKVFPRRKCVYISPDGYSYVRNRLVKGDGLCYWTCARNSCNGKIVTKKEPPEIFKITCPHNHPVESDLLKAFEKSKQQNLDMKCELINSDETIAINSNRIVKSQKSTEISYSESLFTCDRESSSAPDSQLLIPLGVNDIQKVFPKRRFVYVSSDGYAYVKRSYYKNRNILSCWECARGSCKAKIVTKGDPPEIVQIRRQHHHGHEVELLEARKRTGMSNGLVVSGVDKNLNSQNCSELESDSVVDHSTSESSMSLCQAESISYDVVLTPLDKDVSKEMFPRRKSVFVSSDGYFYVPHVFYKTYTTGYWNCLSPECKARIITRGKPPKVCRMTRDHNHEAGNDIFNSL